MKKYTIILLLFLWPTHTLLAQNIDLRLLEYINGPDKPGADKAWRTLTNNANYIDAGVPVTLFVVGLANHDQDIKTKAYTIAAAEAVNFSATFLIKLTANRQRPFVTYPLLINDKASEAAGASFPSGHTSAAFATATSLSMAYPKWYVIAPSFAYASAVGYSRLYLGVHYPSDVLAGAIIGSASAYFTFKAQKWLMKKRASKVPQ